MNNLQKMYNSFQQSPWVDDLSRELLAGKLQNYIDQGVRGLTSNPSILESAVTKSTAYDEQIKSLAINGLSATDIYWRIVEDDIRAALAIFRPIWEESQGQDGFVSLEVSPDLASDANATIEQARRIWKELDAPNLMVKVPATDAGIPAAKTLISEGINVNITLIFSLDHYKRVADAHLDTHSLHSANTARSVASFFVSRVDTEIDKRLELIGTDDALNLRGQAAVAQAHLAYEIFLERFSKNAVLDPTSPTIQRLLWASTSAKNPAYDDLLYVRYLLAPHTVNTLPEVTLDNIIDHLPEDSRNISLVDIEHAHDTMQRLRSVGIDFDDVARTLESEGVLKFQSAFTALISAITAKMN
ncbi:MAG: transaldolase [Candidatus Saccharimonadales bacterium]